MAMCPTRRSILRLFGWRDPEDERWDRLLAVLDSKTDLLERVVNAREREIADER